MSGYRLSRRADADLIDIAAYTFDTWGDAKAIAYVDQLEAACARVAENPGLARRCDHIRPGYSRLEEGRHVLFLKHDPDGVLIVRILHASMDPTLNIDDSDEDE